MAWNNKCNLLASKLRYELLAIRYNSLNTRSFKSSFCLSERIYPLWIRRCLSISYSCVCWLRLLAYFITSLTFICLFINCFSDIVSNSRALKYFSSIRRISKSKGSFSYILANFLDLSNSMNASSYISRSNSMFALDM